MNNTPQAESDNIYYNIQITNNDTSGKTFEAYQQIERTQPIVQNPDDYYLTVNRFSIPATLIPLFIFEIDGTGINNGVYSVTLRYLNFSFQQQLIYVPHNTAIVPPTIANPQQKTPYYFVYSYREILQMFNEAFRQALIGLQGLVGAPLIGAEAPYFIYDSQTGLISLIVQRIFYDVAIVPRIRAFLNIPSLQLFEAFTGTFLSSFITNGENWEFDVSFDGTNGFAPSGLAITNPPTYYKLTSEYVNFRNWSPIRSIVFATNSLSISAEVQPNVLSFGGVTKNETNYRQILTDFEPIIQYPGTERTQLQYYPQGPYRLVDLKSREPIRKFDIALFWADRNNFLYPIYVGYGEVLSVKLLFIKKAIYTNYNEIMSRNMNADKSDFIEGGCCGCPCKQYKMQY